MLTLDDSPRAVFDHEANLNLGGLVAPGGAPSFDNMITAVLLANSAQIALSLSYFAYNAIFTRLQAETEWNSFSISYQPLRVTNPHGSQVSSYRLQLPYRYSLPLLAISVLLHWLTSNSIYLNIVEGGFYGGNSNVYGIYSLGADNHYGVSSDAYIGVGFSSAAIVMIFSIALSLIWVPILLARRKLRGSMVVASSNSSVIAAACHVSTALNGHDSGSRTPVTAGSRSSFFPSDDSESHQLLGPKAALLTPTYQWPKVGAYRRVEDEECGPTGERQIEMKALLSSPFDSITAEEEEHPYREKEAAIRISVARGFLKWGEVKMQAEWYEQFREMGKDVAHLSFGTEDQHVGCAVEDKWYA